MTRSYYIDKIFVSIYFLRIRTHEGEVVDLLSFVVSMLEFVVSFAEVVAVAALIILMGFVIKALPPRIRRVVSSLATTIFILTIFRGLLISHLAPLIIKASIIFYTQFAMSFIALVCVEIVSSFVKADNVKKIRRYDIPPSRQVTYIKHKMQEVYASASFFTLSPVLLQ